MTPFTSSTKEMNVIKATSLALASAMLISNAASAIDGPLHYTQFQQYILPYNPKLEAPPPAPPPSSWTERFGGWISEKLDDWEQSKKDAENRRLRKIYIECQASSATEVQASACYALKTGKY
jgi:hypothetical protein